MKESIFSKYRAFVESKRDRTLLPILAEMVADAILFQERKAISGHLNTEFDASGTLVAHPNGIEFKRSNYSKFEEFREELTGESEPTFVNGRGIHHRTYHDATDEIFEEFLSQNREHIVSVVSKEEKQFLLSICERTKIDNIDPMDIQKIFETLGFYEDEVEMKIGFDEWSRNLDFEWLFRIGEVFARKSQQEDFRKKTKENAELERQKRIDQVEGERANKILETLKKKYKLKHQAELPSVIGKFGPYLQQIKLFLQDLSEEEKESFFLYGPFSKKIRDEAHIKRTSKKEDESV